MKTLFNKSRLFLFLKYLSIFALFYFMGLANINSVLKPFAFGILFSLVWCNQNVFVLAPIYVASMFLTNFALIDLYNALGTVIIMLVCYGIHFKLKKPIKIWMLCIYSLLSQGLTLFFQISSGTFVVFPILNVVLGVGFMYASAKVLSAVIVRGFKGKLTISELIYGGIMLLALSSGVSEVNILGFEFIKLFATMFILLSAYTFNITTSLMSAGIIGLGTLLNSNNPMFLSVFIIWALAVSAFKFKSRYIPCIALIACEIMLGLYFKIYYSYNIISITSVLVGCFSFVIIPSKLLDEFSGYFSTSSDRMAMRNIVNRNRASLSRRLNELADVFNEMNKVFRSMIQGGLSSNDAKRMLVSDIKERVCKDCPEINRCHRTYSEDMDKLFNDFVSAAFERGKVSLLDIPPFLTTRCNKTNNIISVVNGLSDQYKRYAGMMNNLDASKVLIAEQLGGISGIMKNLSIEVNNNITFDAGRENKITEELTYNNIICSDAVIYEQNCDIVNCTIIIKTETINLAKIENIVSRVCQNKMFIASEEPSPRVGWTVLSLRTAPKYDIVFGTASQVKSSSLVSGDSYSLIRIENDKFMLALCDGMGSGIKAEKASNLAIGLVENFYKAGFDNDIILSSVNKLLALGNEEVFSALDLCVIDLRKGIADLIKLGAPNGFIKHKHKTETIETSSLPLGILGEIQPYYKKIVLSSSDMVILCTDGITDSFMTSSDLIDFINENQTTNPQLLAEEILNKSIDNQRGVALDDMTVLVARVFNRA